MQSINFNKKGCVTMDFSKQREELRKSTFPTTGLVIVSALGFIGLLFIIFSGIFSVRNYEMLYECISKNGILVIFGLFFLIISLYCWILFFRNIILYPKKEILYLSENDEGRTVFINKKGKRFIYNSCKKEKNKYYYVMKTHDYIYEVLEECKENLTSSTPKEKKSYWLNFYSPMGNYENLLLLPIVYIILVPGLLSFIMAKGANRIYGLIISAVPIYAIIYDLIYKIKLKKSNSDAIDDSKLILSFEFIKKIIGVIGLSIVCIIFIGIFFNLSGMTSKIIFSPFLVCALCTVGLGLSKILGNDKLKRIFQKIYIIIFLVYWFGFLVVWTFFAIKQEGNYIYALFSIPFWIIGIFVTYKYLIKK